MDETLIVESPEIGLVTFRATKWNAIDTFLTIQRELKSGERVPYDCRVTVSQTNERFPPTIFIEFRKTGSRSEFSTDLRGVERRQTGYDSLTPSPSTIRTQIALLLAEGLWAQTERMRLLELLDDYRAQIPLCIERREQLARQVTEMDEMILDYKRKHEALRTQLGVPED